MSNAAAVTRRRPARELGLAVFIVVSAAACIGVVAWNLIVPGPFDWHIQLPAFWQGGIEALLLIALIAGGFASNRGGWMLLVALPAVLYLRRHAVDAPLLLGALYVEIMVGLGAFLRRLAGRASPGDSFDYVLAFVTGLTLWSVCAWTASALQLGSPRQLQWLTVLLAVPAALTRHRPLFLYLFQRMRTQPRAGRIGCGLLAGWLLVLFARSRVAIGSDAPWYGLRPEFTLVPGHSVFESLALTSPVHYYPKFYEVFCLPLGILRDFATIDAMSIMLMLLLLLVCRRILLAIDTPICAHWPLLALVATLPVLANTATYPGPDVFSTLFGMLAAYFSIDWLRTRGSSAAFWFVTSCALACCGKLTAIPYVGVLVLVTLACARWMPRTLSPTQHDDVRGAALTCVLALIAATFVTARTLLLAGVPTIGPDPLLKFWLMLGFSIKPPAGTLPWVNRQVWADVPTLLLDWTFRPQRLPNVVITWFGNVWLWFAAILPVAAWLGWKRGAHARAWPLLALTATGAGLAVGNRYIARGGDGNYFLLAALPAVLYAGSSVARRLATMPRVAVVALLCSGAFALFQASYAFVSGAWSPGTRAFDGKFSESPRGTRKLRRRVMQWAGLETIAVYMKDHDREHDARMTGEIEPAAQCWFPARFEDLETVLYSYPADVASPERIRHFMRINGIRYFTLPKPETNDLNHLPIRPQVRSVAEQLEQLPGAHRIDSRRYLLLDLTGVADEVLDPSPGPDAAATP